MHPVLDESYGSWRTRWRREVFLREQGLDAAPPERLLQAIWRHQRLLRDRLITSQGEPLLVLHPGFWNREAGPDFRQAVIQFGSRTPVAGDIEIDQQERCWTGHHHDQNPNYRGVILHVVWEGNQLGSRPVLALKDRLDASLSELELWLCGESGEPLTPAFQGRCRPCLAQVEPAEVRGLLREAARVRLVAKARELQARARQAGWEQALWEGMLRGLGFKHNTWPMQRMAELLPRLLELDDGRRQPPVVWQARLLGMAGFLVSEFAPSGPSGGRYVQQLWEVWWRLQSELNDWLLPKECWRLHGLRPANHPQRRLALAAHWLADRQMIDRLEMWFQIGGGINQQIAELAKLLAADHDPFWSNHWTLRSRASRRVHPLLGQQRATDLAINFILPWFWVRAESAQNQALQRHAEDLYFNWPAAEDNAVLRLARLRLLGGQRAGWFNQAAEQQGLLQVVHDFCEHTNALCQDCPFPHFLAQRVGE
jgi:hypothetical protein